MNYSQIGDHPDIRRAMMTGDNSIMGMNRKPEKTIECFKCEDTIEDEEIYGGLCRDCAVEKAKKTFTVEIGEAFVQWYNETIADEGVRVQNTRFPIFNNNVNFYDEILDDMSVKSIREMIKYVIDTAIKGKKSRFYGFDYFMTESGYEDYLAETCLDRLRDEYLDWLYETANVNG